MALPNRLTVAVFFAILTACSGGRESSGLDALKQTDVTMPLGDRIRAEMMIAPADWKRGMTYRESLAEDRGMLYLYGRPEPRVVTMHQVKIPLDIVWLDGNKRVVGVMASAPPCQMEEAARCPQYSTREDAQFVLQLPAGMAAKFGLTKGQTVRF